MQGEAAKPRDIADALADAKARKISQRCGHALVIGCDQVLDIDGRLLGKPVDRAEALAHLQMLAGRRHELLSAAVVYIDGQPQWRFVGSARLTMRRPSADYLADYVRRNW